jgi:Cys-rich repeat protein
MKRKKKDCQRTQARKEKEGMSVQPGGTAVTISGAGVGGAGGATRIVTGEAEPRVRKKSCPEATVWLIVSIVLAIALFLAILLPRVKKSEPECTTDGQCPSRICEKNNCVACRDNTDCPSGGVCSGNKCVPCDTKTALCSRNQECIQGQCRAQRGAVCGSNLRCVDGSMCTNKTCQACVVGAQGMCEGQALVAVVVP